MAMLRTIDEQIAEVRREVKLREQVYPHQVTRLKMTQAQADEHLARMRAVLETLERVKAKLDSGRARA